MACRQAPIYGAQRFPHRWLRGHSRPDPYSDTPERSLKPPRKLVGVRLPSGPRGVSKAPVEKLAEVEVLQGDHADVVEQLFEEISVEPVKLLWVELYPSNPRETKVAIRDRSFNEVFTDPGTL